MDAARENAAPPAPIRRAEPGMGTLEIWPLDTGEVALLRLLRLVFGRYWRNIHFGLLIQGAAWEMKAPQEPRIGTMDGYATVDVGAWHFHLCIGPTQGIGTQPTPPELARHRRCARAELYRVLDWKEGTPASWGLRLFNGKDEQQMTVFLPSPFLNDDMKPIRPDWSRLALWDEIRRDFLGLEPDPADRAGKGFRHQ